MLSADAILSYSAKDAAKLFPGNEAEIRKSFKRLAALWHPDHCRDPRADSVFRKIMELRGEVLKNEKTPESRKLQFTKSSGQTFSANVITSSLTDFGKAHVASRSLSFEYEAGLGDIAEIERARIAGFRFADTAMKEQMASALPKLVTHVDLEEGGALNILARPAQEILLVDFIAHFGDMPAVHAAWLGSGLLNIACYLQWAGLVHGAIGQETVLINPETHSIRLVGGWGFSTPAGERPVMLPNRSLDVVPAMAVAGQVATHSLDLELIRRTLREVLGDASGNRLRQSGLPGPIADFLVMPPAKTAFEDYSAWQKALVDAWGPRRFIKFTGRPEDVYGK